MKCWKTPTYMEYMNYIILVFSFTGQTNADNCKVDRNEFNKYPYMVRIVFEGKICAHGSLMSPSRVLATEEPLRRFFFQKQLWPKLLFIIDVYGMGGALQCSITRKLDKIVEPRAYFNMAFYLLKGGFPCTSNRPFLYTRVEDVEKGVYLKNFNDTKDNELCLLPLFQYESKVGEIKVVEVSFVREGSDEYQRWSELSCNGLGNRSSLCIQRNFYAVDPTNELTDFQWYSGAVVICHGQPLGVLNKVIEDPNNKKRVARFERLGYTANIFHAWLSALYKTTKSTTKKTRNTSTTMTSLTMTSLSTTATIHIKRTRRTVNPTYASHKIPSAPTMTISKSTIRSTRMFIRTKPYRVKTSGSSNPVLSSILKFCISVHFILLKYMVF